MGRQKGFAGVKLINVDHNVNTVSGGTGAETEMEVTDSGSN